MQTLKHSYAHCAQAIGAIPPMRRMGDRSLTASPYGLGRWLASLFAIHDVKRMVALDCPWWNVAATKQIDAFLAARPNARVFEYGAGASTVWLARRAASVTSVEHHAGWYESFRAHLAGHVNAQLLHCELGDVNCSPYITAIDAYGQFDVIVVDGRERAACLAAAIPHLAPGGMIVFDDSGRGRYRSAIVNCGLTERHHFGRSFCVPYLDHTSILTRQG